MELIAKLKIFAVWIVSVLIDCVFLGLWVPLQSGADAFISYFDISAIDAFVLVAFKVIFAISTLAPIVIYTVADIWIMVARAKAAVKRGKLHK